MKLLVFDVFKLLLKFVVNGTWFGILLGRIKFGKLLGICRLRFWKLEYWRLGICMLGFWLKF